WEVEYSAEQRRGRKFLRNSNQRREITRPAHGDRADDQAVFEDQGPADEPGYQLSEDHVAVGVSGSRSRDHCRDLGISECGCRADDSRDDKAQHHRRPGLARGSADQDENAGADDRADAEEDEMRPGKRAMKPVFLRYQFRRGDDLADTPVFHACPLFSATLASPASRVNNPWRFGRWHPIDRRSIPSTKARASE